MHCYLSICDYFFEKKSLPLLTVNLIFQVLLVQEDQEGTKDLRDHLVSLARREGLGKRVVQGIKDPKECRVHQDHQVRQGQKDSMAYLATPDQRAPEDQEEGPDLLVVKESQVLPVCLEEMDSRVLRGHRVHRESEAQWGRLVSKDQGVYQDQ
ncbi:hypothetical protein EYF80_023998 [Liparis tanakae]|uniref:Uncharacterized protein n=1 Tax=Liparis tanakae TaxID=230148 RepID=A0A4Z2HJB1_9TELE|nr:hypothetical protein EYF80_023998 [Liparis tanakae]